MKKINVVGKPHPNIFERIDVIKKEEATSKMKMYETRTTQAPRKKTWERVRRMQALFDRFNGGTMSIHLDEFLEAIKHQTGL